MQEEFLSTFEDLKNFEPSLEISEKIQFFEKRRNARICALVGNENSTLQELINKLSSLTQIERVLAYCLRYMFNLRRAPGEQDSSRLSASELQAAHIRLIRHVQATELADEIADLKRKCGLKSTSKILQLHPFMDEQGCSQDGRATPVFIVDVRAKASHNFAGWNSAFEIIIRERTSSFVARRSTALVVLYNGAILASQGPRLGETSVP